MNNFCIPHILEDIYIQTQDKTAIVSNSGEISFKELYKQSICLSNILSNLGVKKGDRIGVCMNKSIDQVIVILSCLYSNSIFVPVLPNLKEDNIKHIISDSGMKLLITDHNRINEIRKFSNKVEILNIEKNIKSSEIFKNWALQIKTPLNKFNCISEDSAAIIYSSGSTGRPKGIVVSHKNFYDGAKIVSKVSRNK